MLWYILTAGRRPPATTILWRIVASALLRGMAVCPCTGGADTPVCQPKTADKSVCATGPNVHAGLQNFGLSIPEWSASACPTA